MKTEKIITLQDKLKNIRSTLLDRQDISRVDIEEISSFYIAGGKEKPSFLKEVMVSNFRSKVGLKETIEFLDKEIYGNINGLNKINENKHIISTMVKDFFLNRKKKIGKIATLKENCNLSSFKQVFPYFNKISRLHPSEFFSNMLTSDVYTINLLTKLKAYEFFNVDKFWFGYSTRNRNFDIIEDQNNSMVLYNYLNRIVQFIDILFPLYTRNYLDKHREVDIKDSTFTVGKLVFLLDNIDLIEKGFESFVKVTNEFLLEQNIIRLNEGEYGHTHNEMTLETSSPISLDEVDDLKAYGEIIDLEKIRKLPGDIAPVSGTTYDSFMFCYLYDNTGLICFLEILADEIKVKR